MVYALLTAKQERKKYRSRRKAFKRRLWDAAFHWDDKTPCHWCHRLITYMQATVDHEPSFALGGKWDGAVLACGRCNAKRGAGYRSRRQWLWTAAARAAG